MEIPAIDTRDQLATADEVRVRINPQLMDGKLPPDLSAHPLIARPADKHPMLIHVIVGDVRRVLEDSPISRNGKAVSLDAVSEILIANE
jgi:hypothetical protein